MRIAALLFAVLTLAAPAAAAPTAVMLGEVRIGLDTPPGFSDTRFTGSPRLSELAESLTSASNRILIFALTDADLRAFMTGERPELRRYMLAATPRRLEREHVTPALFTRFVEDATREHGSAPPPDTDLRAYLDAKPRETPTLLAELRRTPDLVSVLQGARIQGESSFWGEKPRYLISTTTLLLLRGKALGLSVYSNFDGPADLEWIRYATDRWLEELQRLNAR